MLEHQRHLQAIMLQMAMTAREYDLSTRAQVHRLIATSISLPDRRLCALVVAIVGAQRARLRESIRL